MEKKEDEHFQQICITNTSLQFLPEIMMLTNALALSQANYFTLFQIKLECSPGTTYPTHMTLTFDLPE